jgi:heptose I phosphotransferase
LQLQSYLAIDELIDMLPLNEAVAVAESELDQATFQNWKRRAALELARLTRILHGYGRYHKDLYLCHFFVQRPTPNDQGPRRGEMFMIDLHRMRQHRLTGWYWRIKDLAQLLYSSDLPQVTVWDRVRFFRAYLGRRVDRRLLSAVVLKAGRYRRHNHKQSARPMNARQRVGVR